MASPLAVSAEQLKSHKAGVQPLCLAEEVYLHWGCITVYHSRVNDGQAETVVDTLYYMSHRCDARRLTAESRTDIILS